MLSQRILEDMKQPIGRARCLPGLTYYDPDFMKLECSRVFARSWVSIGFGYQVARPGQIVPVTIAGQPLIMVHEPEGTIRVFHNVC